MSYNAKQDSERKQNAWHGGYRFEIRTGFWWTIRVVRRPHRFTGAELPGPQVAQTRSSAPRRPGYRH